MSDWQFSINIAVLVLTIVAIVYGPIRAVQVTRQGDKAREERDRRYNVLYDLMRTRRTRIDPTHVGALNLIELVYYGRKSIIDAYRNYARHLNIAFPQDEDALRRHVEASDDLFTDLLYEMAKDLGFNFDKRDLFRLSYHPEGLGNYQSNAIINTSLLREVLEGKRAVPISNFIADHSLFPPPPTIE